MVAVKGVSNLLSKKTVKIVVWEANVVADCKLQKAALKVNIGIVEHLNGLVGSLLLRYSAADGLEQDSRGNTHRFRPRSFNMVHRARTQQLSQTDDWWAVIIRVVRHECDVLFSSSYSSVVSPVSFSFISLLGFYQCLLFSLFVFSRFLFTVNSCLLAPRC